MPDLTRREYEQHKEICGRSFEKILQRLESIDVRLFRDNGNVSVQTQIRLNSEAIITMKRLTWILVAAVLTAVAGILIQRI